MSEAWFCPGCNKYHAPHVETCPGHQFDGFPFKPFHPKPDSVMERQCEKCGIMLNGAMGYVCPYTDCPSGLGGATS